MEPSPDLSSAAGDPGIAGSASDLEFGAFKRPDLATTLDALTPPLGQRLDRAKAAWARAPRSARVPMTVAGGVVLVCVLVLTIQGLLSIGDDDVHESTTLQLPLFVPPVPAPVGHPPPAAEKENAVGRDAPPPPLADAPGPSPRPGTSTAIRDDLEKPVGASDGPRSRGGPGRRTASAMRSRPPARSSAEGAGSAGQSDPDDVLPIVER
jgi:hypothetical protein